MTRHKTTYDRPGKGRWNKDNTNVNEVDYVKLKRKLRIMDNDRKTYANEIHHILKKQGCEIDVLAKENRKIRHSLTVAHGPQQIDADIRNTHSLKELLAARDNYERMTTIETISCRELDVKIHSLRDQLTKLNQDIGSETFQHDLRVSRQRSMKQLENHVNRLTTDWCALLHSNEAMRSSIELLIKEKKIYQDIYLRVTDRISEYKKKIVSATKEASNHYEQRLEALAKTKTLKERCSKDDAMFQAEMKVLQRMVAHDNKMKRFMNTKENERLSDKAEEAEKRAKLSVKEKALNEESTNVQKYEDLFENVRTVTGHNDIEKVVNEFTAKDDENFARFDYVSELNCDVEELREYIQNIKNNIKRVEDEDQQADMGSNQTISDLKRTKDKLKSVLVKEKTKLKELQEMIDTVCGGVHLLFKRISCSSDPLKMSLAFEDHVSMENIPVYLTLIEQRCMQLICILKFIGLHQDHHENLLKTPRSIHRIRPRGPSKILLEMVEQKPVMPSINTPTISEDLIDTMLDSEDISMPMDIEQLRSIAKRKIAKKEAAGLLNHPLFVQDKRGKPKAKKK